MKTPIHKTWKLGKNVTIDFSIRFDAAETPEIEELTEEELEAFMDRLEEELQAMDANEPEDEDSEAYDEWWEEQMALQDLIDTVEEQMETMQE